MQSVIYILVVVPEGNGSGYTAWFSTFLTFESRTQMRADVVPIHKSKAMRNKVLYEMRRDSVRVDQLVEYSLLSSVVVSARDSVGTGL